MRFPPAFLDEIRDRVPISAVVGSRVPWDRKKTNASRGDYWACCPFHGEKTPSFHCEDRKGRYHCFGCGVSGDHFKFLTELDGMSFPEAVERIAGLAGLPMPARDPDAERRDQERATLHDVMELAATFFQDRLQTAEGAKARQPVGGGKAERQRRHGGGDADDGAVDQMMLDGPVLEDEAPMIEHRREQPDRVRRQQITLALESAGDHPQQRKQEQCHDGAVRGHTDGFTRRSGAST